MITAPSTIPYYRLPGKSSAYLYIMADIVENITQGTVQKESVQIAQDISLSVHVKKSRRSGLQRGSWHVKSEKQTIQDITVLSEQVPKYSEWHVKAWAALVWCL